VRGALDAYLERDAERARRVWSQDSTIDDWYDSIFRELVTYIMEDARSISASAHLLFVAKNVERVGDHCTNIAGEVYFLVEGRRLSESRPKGADARLADVPPPD
jgi:phosphate transport system protein